MPSRASQPAALSRREMQRAAYVAGRIEDEPTAAALVATCAEMFPVGFVVNNAGITRDKSLMKMGVDEFDDVVAVHLRGTWLMCRAAR